VSDSEIRAMVSWITATNPRIGGILDVSLMSSPSNRRLF